MTLVVDASALAEYLVAGTLGQQAAERMAEHAGELHLPHLAVVEASSVLRSWVRRREVAPDRAAAALIDLAEFPAERWPSEPLLARMWELRENVTAYDACYVALAELLDAPLLTADHRLARAVTDHCTCAVTTLTVRSR